MNRRDFLVETGALAVASGFAPRVFASEIPIPPDIKITRIVGFDLVSRRSKFAGKNSRLDDHGDRATDRMVRIYTNAGIEGLGNCRADENELSALLGKPVADFYNGSKPRITALGNGTMPLWDLIGKSVEKPVYELLGAKEPEKVKVYDGSIYFADLLRENAADPLAPFVREIDMGLRSGHRAFKIKIGRGAKWMEAKEGRQRDIDVLQLIRKHAGPDVALGVDANNGYDLAGTKRLLSDLPDFNFAFVEEMFPEQIDECLELKSFIREQGWKTLLADGETQSKLEVFKPFIEAQAIDVLQGDMNHFGFEGIMAEAKWAEPAGILIAPHNWGSLIGFYMQLHVGRAIPNFYMAEHDPLSNDVIVAEGYEIKNGTCSVPNAPGFGLEVDEAKFRTHAKKRFDLKA